jgi:hypothetical protein
MQDDLVDVGSWILPSVAQLRPPQGPRCGGNPLSHIGFKVVENVFFCLFLREFFLLTEGIIKFPWASVSYICREKGRHYCVEVEGYMCIYTAAGYPELFVYGVLILSRKISAWRLLEILFHSSFIPFHLPPTNVVLVTTTNKLTDSLYLNIYRTYSQPHQPVLDKICHEYLSKQ